jgi:predicted RNase H-like nuclease (RuvC/YqgF family)
LIFGVDIASGSPSSRHPPSYSLVILDGDDRSAQHMVSRHKLIRLIRERQPEIVAMDNVYELASDRRELVSILRRLPPSTKLVQVTGGEHPEALTKLAKWHGMSFNRLNPLEEAEICARLAARGVGQMLSAFEDRTWIKVSRRRSPGRGGWSQNRYSRKIHGAVKGLAREVEKQLREAGLDFTSRAVEGLGGYTRAEFMVNAPRDKVHVHPGYYSDAQVKVQGIELPSLQFKPLAHKRGYIIVGLDPGTTTGIAALNLQGDLIDLISSRAMSSSDVIEWIAARGRPLVVATDVFPTPGAVEKVKRSFNAVLYSPGSDVPAEEKISLAKEFGYKNDHERDALAAAVSAFKKYKNKFLQVEKKVPAEIDPDEAKALVVRGYSIENAIAELTAQPIPEAKEAPSTEITSAGITPAEIGSLPEASALKSQNQQLAEQVKTLRSYVDDLKSDLAEKEEIINRLSNRLDRLKDKTAREIKRDQEIKIRDKEIERLRAVLRSERKYTKKLKRSLTRQKKAEQIEEIKGLRRLAHLEAFSKEAVAFALEQKRVGQSDLVFLEDASGGGKNTAELLVEQGIAGIITDSDMAPAVREHFLERGIPVFSSKELPVQRIDGLPFVRPEDVDAAQARWEDQMKARQAKRQAEHLESIFQEYRVERKREEKRLRK